TRAGSATEVRPPAGGKTERLPRASPVAASDRPPGREVATLPVGPPPRVADSGSRPPPAVRPQRSRPSRTRRSPALLLLLLVPAGLLIVATQMVHHRSTPSATPPAGTTLAPTTTSKGQGPRPTGAAPAAAAPAGWHTYTDPDTGFTLAYPPTWNVQRRGTLTDLRDPASPTYVRIDHQTPPAPTADGPWYALEPAFAASNAGYKRIGITRTTFKGNPAAIWEYTYGSGDQTLHAIDLGMIAGSHGFAFNFQTTDANWAQAQGLLTAVEDSFQP
ncbi:MAG: hypothetical protein M3N98_11675, partial [Actinomycetota bacterium]|nr:hypothetical protein [Actinomycetota bacterium]